MTTLNAAEKSHARKVLEDQARARILDRDALAPADVEAFLRTVYALTPAVRQRKLDEEGAREWTPKDGPAEWLREQRGEWVEPVEGWGRALLREAMSRPLNLDVFTGAFLTPSEPVTPLTYSGHGIGHTWDRPDVPR